MDSETANRFLDAAVDAANTTGAMFEAITARDKGELSDGDAVGVVEDYLRAKSHFDNMITTHGVIG